jgi:hypothetical protein
VVTSASPLPTARETRDAVEEICCHAQLLAEPWRCQLQAAGRTVEELSDALGDSSALRSIRTLAAAAAREAALAARFDAKLLALSHERLRLLSAELEASFATLRGRRAEAAVHLESATDDLLDALRARLASRSEARTDDPVPHREDCLADDVASVMRAYADRVERLLVDLCESAQNSVGAPTGGLVAPRDSRLSPRPDLHVVPVGHDEQLADQLSEVDGRAVDIFRDQLSRQVEDAIESLEDRIDRAVQCQAQGEQTVRNRSDELVRVSQRMDQLAHALEAAR